MMVADIVKHNWVGREKNKAYCPECGGWTTNLPMYKDQVCPAKNRRRNGERRGKK